MSVKMAQQKEKRTSQRKAFNDVLFVAPCTTCSAKQKAHCLQHCTKTDAGSLSEEMHILNKTNEQGFWFILPMVIHGSGRKLSM